MLQPNHCETPAGSLERDSKQCPYSRKHHAAEYPKPVRGILLIVINIKPHPPPGAWFPSIINLTPRPIASPPLLLDSKSDAPRRLLPLNPLVESKPRFKAE